MTTNLERIKEFEKTKYYGKEMLSFLKSAQEEIDSLTEIQGEWVEKIAEAEEQIQIRTDRCLELETENKKLKEQLEKLTFIKQLPPEKKIICPECALITVELLNEKQKEIESEWHKAEVNANVWHELEAEYGKEIKELKEAIKKLLKTIDTGRAFGNEEIEVIRKSVLLEDLRRCVE